MLYHSTVTPPVSVHRPVRPGVVGLTQRGGDSENLSPGRGTRVSKSTVFERRSFLFPVILVSKVGQAGTPGVLIEVVLPPWNQG